MLVQKGMIATSKSAQSLSLQADPGESFIVTNIFFNSTTSNAYLTVSIDTTTVGYFLVSNDLLGSRLAFPSQDQQSRTILDLLTKLGIFSGYPIAVGQTFKVDVGNASAGAITIVYDRYDEDDIKRTMPNGSESTSLVYISEGEPAANVSLGVWTDYDTLNNPSEFIGFPFTGGVPANHSLKIHALLASERAGDDDTTAANNCLTNYYRFTRNTKILFDADRNGHLALGVTVSSGGTFEAGEGYCPFGDYTDLIQRYPLMFDPALEFEQGEELLFQVKTEVAGTPGTLLADELKVAFVIESTRS